VRVVGGQLRAFRVPLAGVSLGDVILAALFLLAAETEALTSPPGPSGRQSISTATSVAMLSLAWRRRWPVLPIALITAVSVVQVAAGTTTAVGIPILALFVASFSLGAYAGNRDLAIGVLLQLASIIARQLLNPRYSLITVLPFFALFVVGAPIIAGRAIKSRGELVRELQHQQTALSAEREARVAEALAGERVEVMSELHDIVSDGVDKLVAYVAIAESDSGERGRTSVVQVETTARAVLDEMRKLLVALAQPNGRAAPMSGTKASDERHRRHETLGVEDEPAGATVSRLSRTGELIGRWPQVAAVAFFLGLELELQLPHHSMASRALYLLGGFAIAMPLAWSRPRPLLAATASLAAAGVFSAFVFPLGGFTTPLALVLVPPFSVAAFTEKRRAILGLLVCVLGLAAALGPSNFAPGSVFAAGAWAAGRLLRDRTRLATELRNTNRRLAAERDSRARQLVVAERARVARELHDVIGHSLTVIVLQAGAARRMWEPDHEQAVTALNTVSRVAREGLTELLRSLDSLEGEDGQPLRSDRLAKPDGLVGRARLAGLDVSLAVEGSVLALDPALEHAAYRVLQEALTNVLKHAPRSQASVTLRYSDRQLDLEVVNFPISVSAPRKTNSSGRGLIGMRQRVAALGGRLEVEEEANGRFELRAQFPIEVGAQ
jgi:signal transduction histidine kinase